MARFLLGAASIPSYTTIRQNIRKGALGACLASLQVAQHDLRYDRACRVVVITTALDCNPDAVELL